MSEVNCANFISLVDMLHLIVFLNSYYFLHYFWNFMDGNISTLWIENSGFVCLVSTIFSFNGFLDKMGDPI